MYLVTFYYVSFVKVPLLHHLILSDLLLDRNFNQSSYSSCHQDLCKCYEGQYITSDIILHRHKMGISSYFQRTQLYPFASLNCQGSSWQQISFKDGEQ